MLGQTISIPAIGVPLFVETCDRDELGRKAVELLVQRNRTHLFDAGHLLVERCVAEKWEAKSREVRHVPHREGVPRCGGARADDAAFRELVFRKACAGDNSRVVHVCEERVDLLCFRRKLGAREEQPVTARKRGAVDDGVQRCDELLPRCDREGIDVGVIHLAERERADLVFVAVDSDEDFAELVRGFDELREPRQILAWVFAEKTRTDSKHVNNSLLRATQSLG